MSYDPEYHHRRSIRLMGYDYSQAGFYFVTANADEKKLLFGKIVDCKMICNDAGQFVEKCWAEIPTHFPNIILHEFSILPDHIHGIIEIADPGINSRTVGVDEMLSKNAWKNNFLTEGKIKFTSPSKSLGSVIRGFKIGVTKWFKENNTNLEKVWQRDYFDEIIRDFQAYQNITNYIKNNPANWKKNKKSK